MAGKIGKLVLVVVIIALGLFIAFGGNPLTRSATIEPIAKVHIPQ